MSNYVTLLGAEEVRSAASTMRSAADEMQRAASSMEYSLQQHRIWTDDWLVRLEQILDARAHRLTP